MTNMSIAFQLAGDKTYPATYEAYRKHIVKTAKALKHSSALFTKFGRREASRMSLHEIAAVFGLRAAHFVHKLRTGQLVVGKAVRA